MYTPMYVHTYVCTLHIRLGYNVNIPLRDLLLSDTGCYFKQLGLGQAWILRARVGPEYWGLESGLNTEGSGRAWAGLCWLENFMK
jgi:hypothetical protein